MTTTSSSRSSTVSSRLKLPPDPPASPIQLLWSLLNHRRDSPLLPSSLADLIHRLPGDSSNFLNLRSRYFWVRTGVKLVVDLGCRPIRHAQPLVDIGDGLAAAAFLRRSFFCRREGRVSGTG